MPIIPDIIATPLWKISDEETLHAVKVSSHNRWNSKVARVVVF